MRVVSMHYASPISEASVPPSAELMQGMGGLIQAAIASGSFVNGGGLRASEFGVRVHFTEAKEMIAGFFIFKVKTIAEALEWSDRFAAVVGDYGGELRRLYEDTDAT